MAGGCGPARIGPILGLPASTVHRVLTPARPEAARLRGPADRNRHPTLRARPAGRAGVRRHQETGEHPRRRRPPRPDPPDRRDKPPGHHAGAQPLRHPEDQLQLHPHRRGRPLPSGLQRDPHRRTQGNCRGLLAPSPGILRRQRNHRRACPDRQRLLLQIPRLAPSPGHSRHHPQAHPGPTDHRPTGKSNASTAPCSPNGPTCLPTPATPNEPQRSHPSCTPTTTTAATPHSAASHPSPASTTLRVNTTSGSVAGYP